MTEIPKAGDWLNFAIRSALNTELRSVFSWIEVESDSIRVEPSVSFSLDLYHSYIIVRLQMRVDHSIMPELRSRMGRLRGWKEKDYSESFREYPSRTTHQETVWNWVWTEQGRQEE